VGGRRNLRQEVQDSGRTAAGQSSRKIAEDVGRAVLEAENRTLSDRAIPQMDEEPRQREMRMLPVQEADQRAPLQGLPPVEAATKNPVGRGAKGHRPGNKPFQNWGLIRGWTVFPGDHGFLRTTKVGRRVESDREQEKGGRKRQGRRALGRVPNSPSCPPVLSATSA
jgi:hypothetical protein